MCLRHWEGSTGYNFSCEFLSNLISFHLSNQRLITVDLIVVQLTRGFLVWCGLVFLVMDTSMLDTNVNLNLDNFLTK